MRNKSKNLIPSKVLLVNLFTLFFNLDIAFAKVPLSWIGADSDFNINTNSGFLNSNISESAISNHTEEDFDKLFDIGVQIIDPESTQAEQLLFGNKKRPKKPWYLQSLKTELGIESSGNIGLVGLEGEAAVELIWTRTALSLAKLQKKQFGDTDLPDTTPIAPNSQSVENASADLTLTTDMSQNEVATEIDGLVEYIGRTGKVSNLDQLKSQLLSRILNAQDLAAKTEEVSDSTNWSPYKYQLMVYVSAGGMVMPATVVGGVMRLRFEWNLKPRTVKTLSPTASFWQDLDGQFELLQNRDIKSNDYRVVAVKIGLGFGMEGDIGIAEGKFAVMGSVFLKPTKPVADYLANSKLTCEDLSSPINKSIPYYYSDEQLTEKRSIFKPISKFLFCKNLEKVSKISSFITQAATRHEQKQDRKKNDRNFELGNIEIELQISANGGIFLPTVTKTAFFEIFFTKSNLIK